MCVFVGRRCRIDFSLEEYAFVISELPDRGKESWRHKELQNALIDPYLVKKRRIVKKKHNFFIRKLKLSSCFLLHLLLWWVSAVIADPKRQLLLLDQYSLAIIALQQRYSLGYRHQLCVLHHSGHHCCFSFLSFYHLYLSFSPPFPSSCPQLSFTQLLFSLLLFSIQQPFFLQLSSTLQLSSLSSLLL